MYSGVRTGHYLDSHDFTLAPFVLVLNNGSILLVVTLLFGFFSVSVGAFVIGLSQISSSFSYMLILERSCVIKTHTIRKVLLLYECCVRGGHDFSTNFSDRDMSRNVCNHI